MKDAFGVEISKGLPSYLREGVKESGAVGGTNRKVEEYMRGRYLAHRSGRRAAKYRSGRAASNGKVTRNLNRMKLRDINNISKGMPSFLHEAVKASDAAAKGTVGMEQHFARTKGPGALGRATEAHLWGGRRTATRTQPEGMYQVHRIARNAYGKEASSPASIKYSIKNGSKAKKRSLNLQSKLTPAPKARPLGNI